MPLQALAEDGPRADAAAPADDQTKDPIVVTGTRIPTPASEVPATVTVITADDIADTLSADIKDLVRFEPGVSVRRAPTRSSARSCGARTTPIESA
jgi:hemoglobin/transferrin/lactoferrin receptor protein